MTIDAISPRLKRDVSALEDIVVIVTSFIASVAILVYYPWLAVPIFLFGLYALFRIFQRSRSKKNQYSGRKQDDSGSLLSKMGNK